MTVQKGFTLIEMLVVLAIIAVMAMVAIPAYHAMMQRFESQSSKRHIAEAIRRAKIEANLHQKDIILCPYGVNEQCDRLGQVGLLVFVDKNSNNRLDDADIVSMKQPLELRYGLLSMRVSLGRHYIKFMSDNAKPRGHIGNIRYCNTEQNNSLSHLTTINMHGVVTAKSGDVVSIDCG